MQDNTRLVCIEHNGGNSQIIVAAILHDIIKAVQELAHSCQPSIRILPQLFLKSCFLLIYELSFHFQKRGEAAIFFDI